MQSHIPNTWKWPRHTGSKTGSALITVLGISLILMLAGTTMVVLSRQSIHRIQRTANYAQAQAVAEAGVADMLANLGTNYNALAGQPLHVSLFSHGTYDVTTQPKNGHVLIISDGIYKGESNRTIMELSQNIYDITSAILANGTITLDTGAFELHGNVHANQGINVNGNGTIDNGTYSASGNVIPSNKGLSDTPVIPLPTFNFASYQQMAISGGYYTNATTAMSMSGKPIALPANGILYINGDLTINNNSDFKGTIVVNGNITIVNNFDQYTFSGRPDWPSLLSTGTITINNKTTLNGVVYAVVGVDLQNNTTINGGVISGGYISIKNKVTINHATGYPAWDPLNPGLPSSGGWLK